MTFGMILTAILISVTNLTITEPVEGETYNGDWLPLRAIVENENELPDSVHYSLNGGAAVLIPRLNTDWFTYMANNSNTGYSESPAPMDNTLLWTAAVTGNLHEFPTPVIVNGIVYYPQDCSGDSLFALDSATGELIWKYRAGGCDDAVTVVDGLLYSSAYDSLYCLNALTGERIWATSEANSAGSTPVVAEGRIYCGKHASGSCISCLDAYTGTEIWSATISGFTASCMAVWNGMVFIPTVVTGPETSLYALDANTGSILWDNSDAFGGYWDCSPTVADSTIYISGCDGRTRAIDAMTGLTIWEVQTSLYEITATPAYHNGRLYFAEQDGSGASYHCLEASTGSTIWSVRGHQHGSSCIADGVVFYGDNDTLGAEVRAMDCGSGAELWSYLTGGHLIMSSPSITDGVVYIAAIDWNLYAFGTGLKYTYREDYFYADVGPNELIMTSFDGGAAVAADTINFTVTQTGITLEPSSRLALCASPNPFYSTASISFELSEPGWTSVTVYDLSGRIVRTLESSELGTGQHSILWDGRKENGEVVSAGLYICRIQSCGVSETTGLCLLR